jgi:hypothetical protein
MKVEIKTLYTVVEVKGPGGGKCEMRLAGELGPVLELVEMSERIGGKLYVVDTRSGFSRTFDDLFAKMLDRPAVECEVVAGAENLVERLAQPAPSMPLTSTRPRSSCLEPGNAP